MTDATPGPPPNSEQPPSGPQTPATDFDIGEEFGTAKRNLPPPKVLLIGVAAVLVVAAIVIFGASRPSGVGSIDNVTAVEIPNQNSVLVAINVSLHNRSDKPFWIHTLTAKLKTDSGEFPDEAASPVDFERYFQAFPALKQNAIQPLKVETRIEPGGEAKGTIIVSFPVTQDGFDKRKSLSVSIQPYDQRPVVITK